MDDAADVTNAADAANVAVDTIVEATVIRESHLSQFQEKKEKHEHPEAEEEEEETASAPDEEGLLPSYDCVILGTGLTESIVACALARAGVCVCARVCVCVCVCVYVRVRACYVCIWVGALG
jgi:hypothetical protein